MADILEIAIPDGEDPRDYDIASQVPEGRKVLSSVRRYDFSVKPPQLIVQLTLED